MNRISVGGAFAYVAIGAVVGAARELLEQGTYGFWNTAGPGAAAARGLHELIGSPRKNASTSGSAARSWAKNACPPS